MLTEKGDSMKRGVIVAALVALAALALGAANGFAVTYDNAYAGFACGFYEKGDVKLNLYATGGPGTHLIDLYPMIYKGKSTDLWNQQLPMLAFRQDNPALALGYKLPAMRVAIRVVK